MLNSKQKKEHHIKTNQVEQITTEDLKLIGDVDLSEIHDCEKCHGKIVGITVDKLGITRCGYCNEIVDYMGFYRRKIWEKKNGLLK